VTHDVARRAPSRREEQATPGRRRRAGRRFSRRDILVVVAMLAIPVLGDIAFIWGPAVVSIALSLFKWSGIGGLHARSCIPGGLFPDNGCFTGVGNYHEAATNYPPFWPAVQHNLIWLGVFVFVATPLGMFFAVLIDTGLRGSRVYQTLLFLPVMLSLALIGIIWEFFYSPNYGLINTVTGHNTNANLIDWLGDPSLNLWAVLVEASWRQAGYVMVLYLAGLKAVDANLKEAARIDGANAWQTFWRVTFPSMMPMNIVVAVVTVIESLRAFDLVYITNKGTNGLELLSALVTSNIVGETSRIGFGSAIGVVLLVIALVPISAFLYQMFVRREAR
jgi:multiple sugar transport system permease protein